MTGQGAGCLSEHGVVRLLTGALNGAERGEIDGHLGHCDRCARLVGEAARDTGGAGSTGLADRVRPPVLSPGMVIADRYHVRRLLGVGAMGEVHEVEDRLLGTIVALKTLNARLAGDASALARLKREVAAARSVTHPNVCRIFDLGSDPGSEAMGRFAFLTMEYLPGVTLMRFLTAHGPFAPVDAMPLIIQLADGLAAAHAAGIVHRDLKAENVMLVEQKSGVMRGVIMDFGLAGFDMPDEAGVEHGSGFSGTVAYAAPERIAGGRATAASDVYSFGLIVNEMLTNMRPLPGPSAPCRDDGGAFPVGWERLIQRALEVDPKARFANAGTLVEALRELAGGRRAAASGRRPIALAAVAVAVIAAVASWGSRGQHERSVLLKAAPAQPVTMPRPLPDPAADRPHLAQPVVAPVLDRAVASARPPRRPPVRRALALSDGPAKSAAIPANAPAVADPAVPRAPDDDLVREIRFQSTSSTPPGPAASDADLVDPFAHRRAQSADTQP